MTERYDYIVCKEEREDGSYKLYPCYAPWSLLIKEGDTVTIELPCLSFLFAYDDEHGRDYAIESSHDGKEKKHGLKVIGRGGTVTFNEDADFALVPFGRIIYKYEDVYWGETK
jgi:hypothetical protein